MVDDGRIDDPVVGHAVRFGIALLLLSGPQRAGQPWRASRTWLLAEFGDVEEVGDTVIVVEEVVCLKRKLVLGTYDRAGGGDPVVANVVAGPNRSGTIRRNALRERDNSRGQGRESRDGNLIIDERIAHESAARCSLGCGGIVDLQQLTGSVNPVREVALVHFRRGDALNDVVRSFSVAERLIGGVKERAVANDRAAAGSAEVVLLEHGAFAREKAPRVQLFVS